MWDKATALALTSFFFIVRSHAADAADAADGAAGIPPPPPSEPPTHGGGNCTTEMECSLAGECRKSVCSCDAWATGAHCQLLNFRTPESNEGYGLQLPGYHSWGGGALFDGHTYHLIMSFMCNHGSLAQFAPVHLRCVMLDHLMRLSGNRCHLWHRRSGFQECYHCVLPQAMRDRLCPQP